MGGDGAGGADVIDGGVAEGADGIRPVGGVGDEVAEDGGGTVVVGGWKQSSDPGADVLFEAWEAELGPVGVVDLGRGVDGKDGAEAGKCVFEDGARPFADHDVGVQEGLGGGDDGVDGEASGGGEAGGEGGGDVGPEAVGHGVEAEGELVSVVQDGLDEGGGVVLEDGGFAPGGGEEDAEAAVGERRGGRGVGELGEEAVEAGVAVGEEAMGGEVVELLGAAEFTFVMGADAEKSVVGVEGVFAVDAVDGGDGVEDVEVVDGMDGALEVEGFEVGEGHHRGSGVESAEPEGERGAEAEVEGVGVGAKGGVVGVGGGDGDAVGGASGAQGVKGGTEVGPVGGGLGVEGDFAGRGGEGLEGAESVPGEAVESPAAAQGIKHGRRGGVTVSCPRRRGASGAGRRSFGGQKGT